MSLTAEELENIKVGQEVFVRTPYGNKYYPKIERIGRKYFYTSDTRKWERSNGNHVSEYLSASMWSSEGAYISHFDEMQLKDIFRRKLTVLNVSQIPLDKIKAVCDLLDIKLY